MVRSARCSSMAWVVLLLLLSGCITHPHHPRPIVFDYPDSCRDLCEKAVADARVRIESKGTKLEIKKSYYVKLHEGEAKVDGMWAWYYVKPEGDIILVGGLTLGSKTSVITQLGCKPMTMDEVANGPAIHEAAHYWLISNFDDSSHDPLYHDVLGW
jgi:hypothetical protein